MCGSSTCDLALLDVISLRLKDVPYLNILSTVLVDIQYMELHI